MKKLVLLLMIFGAVFHSEAQFKGTIHVVKAREVVADIPAISTQFPKRDRIDGISRNAGIGANFWQLNQFYFGNQKVDSSTTRIRTRGSGINRFWYNSDDFEISYFTIKVFTGESSQAFHAIKGRIPTEAIRMMVMYRNSGTVSIYNIILRKKGATDRNRHNTSYTFTLN